MHSIQEMTTDLIYFRQERTMMAETAIQKETSSLTYIPDVDKFAAIAHVFGDVHVGNVYICHAGSDTFW